MTSTRPATSAALARRARERFIVEVEGRLPRLADAVGHRLLEVADRSANLREAQDRRDAVLDFDRLRAPWLRQTQAALRQALGTLRDAGASRPGFADSLALLDHDTVEKGLLASRLAMALEESAGMELGDLRLRLRHLEGETASDADPLLPQGLATALVEAWLAVGLPHLAWSLVADVVREQLAPVVQAAYQSINEALAADGVLADIDRNRRVRRAAEGTSRPASVPGAVGLPDSVPGAGPRTLGSSPMPAAASAPAAPGWGGVLGPLRRWLGQGGSGAGGAAGAGGAGAQGGVALSPGLAVALGLPVGNAGGGSAGGHGAGGASTVAVTLAAGDAQALSTVGLAGLQAQGRDVAVVAQAARVLRQHATDLKQVAASAQEKAVIEIVALMFQSILSEDRIPPSVRVWIARLQMPVLRLAVADTTFFESLEHPARRLIDRMGGCVLGFDAAAIAGGDLESEISRLVLMIEQYPDSALRAFELACEEFEAFLSRHLTQPAPARRLVTVAQQVEQKETLAVRYTIELRKMLEDVPVREEIRDFLFKVWAEVMAVAAVRHGQQDARTLALQKAAADLVWAASAKPTRAERSQVIAQLPSLLQRLREGMGLMGLHALRQEELLKSISDTLTDAFQSRTAVIPQARIQAIAECLASLEGLVDDDADLPLDADSVAALLGAQAQGVEVITDGGVRPSAATRSQARNLDLGTWFTLDHNGVNRLVQYAWRSEGRHLHLFTTRGGEFILIQLGRLAAYLQAGLLAPGESEALTARAARDALARLDANPERLLA